MFILTGDENAKKPHRAMFAIHIGPAVLGLLCRSWRHKFEPNYEKDFPW